MNRTIGFVWGFLFLAMLSYLFFIQGSLPAHLAVHFDIDGKPNDFQDKTTFITQFCCFTILINGVFLAFTWLIGYIPKALIHIPWKDYWFAKDERKVQAFERLRSVLGLGGIFICGIFMFLEQVIYQSNAKDALISVPINGVVFVVLTLSVFFIALIFIITKPPSEE